MPRDLRDERLAGAAERDERHVAAELVLARGLAHRVGDLRAAPSSSARAASSGVAPQARGQRGEGGEGGLRRSRRVRAAGDEAERVGGARGGQREAAAGAADDA